MLGEELPFWLVKHGLLGLQTKHRYLRGWLARSWDCVGTWEVSREFKNRTPIALEVLNYMCAVAYSWAAEDRDMTQRLFLLWFLFDLFSICFVRANSSS